MASGKGPQQRWLARASRGSAPQACTAAEQVLLEMGRRGLVRVRMRVYAADAWPRLDGWRILGLTSPWGLGGCDP